MDIRKIDDLSPTTMSSPNKPIEKDAFRQIYQERLSMVSQTPAPFLFDAKTDFIDQGDKVLDLLDAYATELNNPEKNLKDIDPLVKAIEKEMNIFEAKRADHPGMDEEMDGIAQDLSITANVALLKFQRGDYI